MFLDWHQSSTILVVILDFKERFNLRFLDLVTMVSKLGFDLWNTLLLGFKLT